MVQLETGYYWILFNWPALTITNELHWEPASYDSRTKSWAIIGSREEISWNSVLILLIGEKINTSNQTCTKYHHVDPHRECILRYTINE